MGAPELLIFLVVLGVPLGIGWLLYRVGRWVEDEQAGRR
jgi:hypothetical protein